MKNSKDEKFMLFLNKLGLSGIGDKTDIEIDQDLLVRISVNDSGASLYHFTVL